VLEALVQSRRNTKAAKRRLRKLLKKPGRGPRVMVTDKLRSDGAAKKEILSGVEHRQRHRQLDRRLTAGGGMMALAQPWSEN
jgi:putative transposase